jgi:cytochrome b561
VAGQPNEEMKTSQLIVMWVGIALLFATWLKPPVDSVSLIQERIEWSHLAMFDLMILVPIIGIILTLGRRR